jgi:uncharacterized membrane protein YgdD (TMEM256/DUF423 family)
MGATGVALGAFGAHALKEVLLERGMNNAWETAVRYHQLHAVALLGAAVWLRQPGAPANALMGWAARCWVVGTLLFSGSLYGLALGGPRLLGPVTPLGGVALLAGWICVMITAVKKEA